MSYKLYRRYLKIRLKELFGIELTFDDIAFLAFKWRFRNVDWNKAMNERNPILDLVNKNERAWHGAVTITPFKAKELQ